MSITAVRVTDLSSIPVGLLVGLGVLGLVELALDVIALVDLVRRPVERVTLGNKWVWVAIIVLVNLVGAILYFAIGRKPALQADQPAQPQQRSAATIADALYGQVDDPKRQ